MESAKREENERGWNARALPRYSYAKMMRSIFITLVLPLALGGSICPPRTSIYPCTCMNIPACGKKYEKTIITCQGLYDVKKFTEILPELAQLDIDVISLYNLYIQPGIPDADRILPMNWACRLKVKEINFYDSNLSQCYICQWNEPCVNRITSSFRITNSSDSSTICEWCVDPTNENQLFPWTAVLMKLQFLAFNYGHLEELTNKLFSEPMPLLLGADFSHNRISKIEKNIFNNLGNLTTLNLSHNALEAFDLSFSPRNTKLKVLDLSYNHIIEFARNLLPSLPSLTTFILSHNNIQKLPGSSWQNISSSIKYIDLFRNPLKCDCSIQWVNSTFQTHVTIKGVCNTPAEYTTTPIRRASRYLNERCDENGNIGSRHQ